VTVTSDLSPVEPALQRFHKRNILKLSAKNVNGCADWERCANEFACDSSWKTLSVTEKHLQPWRKTLMCEVAKPQCQPRAKKRLATDLADEVQPSKLSGKCFV